MSPVRGCDRHADLIHRTWKDRGRLFSRDCVRKYVRNVRVISNMWIREVLCNRIYNRDYTSEPGLWLKEKHFPNWENVILIKWKKRKYHNLRFRSEAKNVLYRCCDDVRSLDTFLDFPDSSRRREKKLPENGKIPRKPVKSFTYSFCTCTRHNILITFIVLVN